MTTGDSNAQQEHTRENKQLTNKGVSKVDQVVIDKKLDGPNRPAE